MRGAPECSVVTLCVATITALTAVAFVGIAFSTDNWTHVSVDRAELVDQRLELEIEGGDLERDYRFFDRVQGIFRVCFPHEEKPLDENLYLNPVEEWCFNNDYHVKLLEYGLLPKRVTRNGELWFHLARSAIAGFALYFMWTGIACVMGFLGCWRASGDHLVSTASLLLLAFLCGGAGMGLWHGAKFYEMEKVLDASLNFYPIWPEYIKDRTQFTVGWSYIVCWVGLGLTLVASILFALAAICIRGDLREMEHEEMMVKMKQAYPSLAGTINAHPSYMIAPDQLSLNGYYPAGYPVQYEPDSRVVNYKNVVKELDAKR